MRKIKWGQLIVLIMILVLALWSIFANFKSIKYGLDLQGGVHLVLQASQILETPAASSGATEGQKAEEKKVQTP